MINSMRLFLVVTVLAWLHAGDAFCPATSCSMIHRPATTYYRNTPSILHSSESSNDNLSPRSKLRQLTGFSLTAIRSTLRAATGISLSQSISGILRRLLSILSPSLRYFLQPFLIMYYTPLMIIRYWVVGPSDQYVEDSRKSHEKVVDGWRRAVEAAEKANNDNYWPVHLMDDGTIVTSLPPDPNELLNLADGIEESVAVTLESNDNAA